MRYLVFSLFCLTFHYTYAQKSIAEKMNWYEKSKNDAVFFVHFDKNVYTNNETIHFTGYLIKPSRSSINEHRIMAALLIRDADTAVVITDKFLMENGLGAGSLTLPDSVLTGDYHVMVYTDKLSNGKPEALFIQPITLKTNIDPSIKVNAKLIEGSNISNQVMIAVTSKDGRFLPKPAKISYKYGNSYKTGNTDMQGQLLISLPPPADHADPNLQIKVVNQKDIAFLKLTIPQNKIRAKVSFYPEGGNMVNGLSGYLGWEVKDAQHSPIALKALLFKNNKVIDTIETNSYGIGKFRLVPDAGSTYTVKLTHSGLMDSVYILPKVLEGGLTITLPNAIAQDTVNLILRTNQPQRLRLLIHNYKKTFINTQTHMESGVKSLLVPLDRIPKGLTTITVLDSLERPLVERLFFAHYDRKDKVSVDLDSKSYNKREKVTVKLRLNSGTQALVSVAAVQDNRLEVKKMNDIVSYTYITNELRDLPLNLYGNAMKDIGFLADMLLVKGWRRYTWEGLHHIKPTDTLLKSDSLGIRGLVTTSSEKRLSEPAYISILGDSELRFVTTSATGEFDFKNPQLILESKRDAYLFAYDKNKNPYRIEQFDDYSAMNKLLLKNISFTSLNIPRKLASNTELLIKTNEKVTQLSEVKITAKKDLSLEMYASTHTEGHPGKNRCGDYVCVFDIFNCRNHVNDGGNVQPVKGRTYKGLSQPYKGCRIVLPSEIKQKEYVTVQGIHWEKEFYHSAYEDPREPAFFSTIYWNYGLPVNAEKDTEFVFFTSDIKGKFRIVVQGISDSDVLYSEQFFDVK